MHKTAKFLCIQHAGVTLKFSFTVSWCKIPGHSTCKREMLILLLAIPGHTYKSIPNKNITMQNNGMSGGTFVRYRYHKFYRSGAGCFRQFMMLSTIFPTICIYINCTTFKIANLFFKTKKNTSHLTYKRYS